MTKNNDIIDLKKEVSDAVEQLDKKTEEELQRLIDRRERNTPIDGIADRDGV